MKQEIKSAAGLEGVLFMSHVARSDSMDALPAGCDVGVCALVAAYPLSFRNIDEMMAERGVFVDHSTLHRWSMKMLPDWRWCFVGASCRSAKAGGWTRPM